jgi:hypothetical protein
LKDLYKTYVTQENPEGDEVDGDFIEWAIKEGYFKKFCYFVEV